MRPGQNKRMRGRNRRGPNPLTRSYESNGPDVKVRGTAQHVAEKYTQLARDAHVSGDPVMAESYLQHAEHYYRLIAAAHQAQLAVQNGTSDDREDDEDDFDTSNDRFTFRSVQQAANGPSAQGERQDAGEGGEGEEGSDPPGAERHAGERQGQDRSGQDRSGQDRQAHRNDRHDRNRQPHRNDRNQDRGFRSGGDRDRDRNRERFDPNRPRRPQPDLEGAEQPVLPAFLTAPVRNIPIELPAEAQAAQRDGNVETSAPALGQDDDAAGAVPRVRRRRRPRIGEEGVNVVEAGAATSADQD